jgi:hypothetical protein
VGLDGAGSGGFVVGFVDRDGVERQVSLDDAPGLALEWCRPVRSFPSYRGQRNWPGLWWAATTGCHVGYESWLERDHAMLLDFDRDVVALAAQPFWLFFLDAGRRRSHAPDFFARRRDGGAVVIDCRPDDRIKPRDVIAFEATTRACESVGWEYRRVGAVDVVLVGNVRWLSGYRHPRFADPVVAERLRAVFAVPRPLLAGAELVGSSTAVLPVLFHLLWCQQLRTDLGAPLTETSLVWVSS